MYMNLHNVNDETVLSCTENRCVLSFTIPATSDFFDGHFPQYHLLPAVAQFELVTRFAKKYFGTARTVPYIKRIKFSAPIRPDTTVTLSLEYDSGREIVSYTLTDAITPDKAYSTGTFGVLRAH
ncbi:MAG: hydroxymyristoyl-ACP dehydratase [Treponema sp.]|nr:hydroxymyristoyl-ACP dehydratase [Treponema sp.]